MLNLVTGWLWVVSLSKRDPYYTKHILKVVYVVGYVNNTVHVLRCTGIWKPIRVIKMNKWRLRIAVQQKKNRANCLLDIPTSSFSQETWYNTGFSNFIQTFLAMNELQTDNRCLPGPVHIHYISSHRASSWCSVTEQTNLQWTPVYLRNAKDTCSCNTLDVDFRKLWIHCPPLQCTKPSMEKELCSK